MVGKICTVCKKSSYANKKLSYFTYPANDLRRHDWLLAVDRLDLMDKLYNPSTRNNHRICETHFERKFIKKNNLPDGRKSLTRDAFPTLCITPSVIEPRTGRNIIIPPSPITHKQSTIWSDRNLTQPEMTITPTIKTYEARHHKPDTKLVDPQPKSLTNQFNQRNDSMQIKPQLKPFLYQDISQYCESIIKISQSTQTPAVNVEHKKRKLDHPETTDKADDDESTFLRMCSSFLSPSLTKLVKWNINVANGKQHVNFTLFALNLYYSSNLYNLLKDVLSLPSTNTFKYFLLPKTTRLSEHFLNVFRSKINNMSTNERICSFSVGTMLLKPSLYYDIKYDRIIGLHEINGVQNICLAKYAVLLMAQGILENWQQPIAYAFISDYDNIPDISMWIDEVLTLLIDIGLDIRVFVSDPRSEFLYASETRSIAPEKTYFTINGTDILYTYDIPQLFRIVKNNLKSCDFYYGPHAKISNNADFFKKLNNLCFVLNANSRSSGSQFKRVFSNEPYQKNFLNHMLRLFQNLKVVRKTNRIDVTDNMKFIQGFQITINSVIQLFEELNFLGVTFLRTSRLNHNCINRFFENLKQRDSKDECTPKQFNRGFVRSFVFNMLKKPGASVNVESSLDSEEYSQQLLEEDIHEVENSFNKPLLVHTIDYRDNLPEKNAFVYVCGYCYLKCLQVHQCDTLQFFLNSFKGKQKRDITFLCSVSLDLNIQNCNMLPPDDFIEYLMLLEKKFREFFKKDIQIRSVGQQLLKELEECDFGMPCPCFPIDYLKALFVRVRLFYTIRKNNKLIRNKKAVKLFRVFSL